MSVDTEKKQENVAPADSATAKIEETTKDFYRQKVWDHLQKARLVNFPRPAYGRIPNFKGADIAAKKLTELVEFQGAKCVEVNPDKALEAARIVTLENDKSLYVPIPRLQQGLLKKLQLGDKKPDNLQPLVTRYALEHKGESIDFDDKIHIDLFVLGSVAVSKDGRRIGKGRGYADLEFAILKEMKAIDDNTTIVTIVHDSQVYDEIPADIFEKYDIPVDFILTPSEIIKIGVKLERPEGIFWNVLSKRRVALMPILQKVKSIHESQGKDTTLKSEDTDVENEEKRRPMNRVRRFSKRRPPINKNDGKLEKVNSPEVKKAPVQRRRRFTAKKPVKNADKENAAPATPTNDTNNAAKKKFRRLSRRSQVDFSLHVSNIDRNVRVRQLKDALIDRGIKPSNITWRGYKGFCLLHYAKPSVKKIEKNAENKGENLVVEQEKNTEEVKDDVKEKDDKEKQFGVDSVIEILQTLKLNAESEGNLSVKVMEPITRIETTDVTAV